MNELTHSQVQFLLRSGETLDPAMQFHLDAHLEKCAECRAYAHLIHKLEQALPAQEAAAAAASRAHQPASDQPARSYDPIQNRSKTMSRTSKNAFGTILWIGMMVLLVAGIGWSIRRFIPASVSSSQPTETPTASATATGTPTIPAIATSSIPAPVTARTAAPGRTPALAATLGPEYPALSAGNVAAFGPLEQIELGGESSPMSLAWSPDGKALALQSQQEILVYRLETPDAAALRWPARGSQVAYSPDGRWLANDTGDSSGSQIELHDPTSGELTGSLPVPVKSASDFSYCTTLVFSPNNASLAAACDGIAYVWDTASLALRWQSEIGVSALAFSPDSQELVVAGWQTALTIYASDSGKQLRLLEGDNWGEILKLVYAPNGAWIAAAGGRDDGTVRVWERATGKLLKKLPGITSWMEGLAISPQGMLLGSNQDDRLLVWDVPTGKLLRTIELDGGMIVQMAFSPDGSRLASTDNWRPVVRLWAVTSQARAFPTDIPPTPAPEETGAAFDYPTIIFGLDWAARAERLVANTTKGIFVYDTVTRQPVFSQAGPAYLNGIALIDPTGGQLAIGTDKWEIWDINSGQQTATLGPVEGSYSINAAFSPDGTQLATPQKNGVQLWNLKTQAPIYLLPIETGARRVIYGPDGKSLLVYTADGWLQSWDLDRYEMTGSVDLGLAFLSTFSPNAAWLAIQRQGGVEVWNTGAGQKQTSFPQCGSDVWFGTFDATGQRLLTGPCLTGSQAMLYPAAGGETLLTLPADFANGVEWRSAAISPDGSLLVLGNSRGQIQFFDASSGQITGTIQVKAP